MGNEEDVIMKIRRRVVVLLLILVSIASFDVGALLGGIASRPAVSVPVIAREQVSQGTALFQHLGGAWR